MPRPKKGTRGKQMSEEDNEEEPKTSASSPNQDDDDDDNNVTNSNTANVNTNKDDEEDDDEDEEDDEDFVPDTALEEEDKKLDAEFLGSKADALRGRQDDSTMNTEQQVADACRKWDSVLDDMNTSDRKYFQQQAQQLVIQNDNAEQPATKLNRKRRANLDMDELMWKLSTNRMKRPKETKGSKKRKSLKALQNLLRQGESAKEQPTTWKKPKKRDSELSKVALEAASNSKDIKTGKSKIKLTETIKYAGKEMEYVEAVDAGSQAAKDLVARKKAREVADIVQRGEQAESASSNSKLDLDTVVSNIDKVRNISTVEKSSSDWDIYKQEKKLDEDELLHATKDGYLHRQDFLSRVQERENQR